LGRRIVQHLLDHQFAVRIASRHPERGKHVFPDTTPALESVRAHIGEDASINATVTDAYGVVNAISLYVERDNQTFHSVHVEAAERVAKYSRDSGAERLVHVSGIGADAASPSPLSAAGGTAKMLSMPHSQGQLSFALRSCSGRTTGS